MNEALKTNAADALEMAIKTGARHYQRTINLPRLLPMTPDQLADMSAAGTEGIIRKLASALRAERTRGQAGHWSYDLNRHIALAQALRAELATLSEVKIQKRKKRDISRAS